MNDLNWAWVQSFVAVAETGALTLAAKQLRSSQPTVGRHIRALEEQLGVPLITRHARGVELTDRGRELADSARLIAEQMVAFERQAQGARDVLGGTVRIAATEIVGVSILPPILAQIRTRYPLIDLELTLDNRAADLTRGDADIAIRLFAPRTLELVGRKVGGLPVGFFASAGYVAQNGAPTTFEMLLEHTLIGFDSRGPMAQLNTQLDARLTPDRFAFRTDSLVAHLEAARHGVGVAALQIEIAGRYPELVQVLPDVSVPPLPVWLVMHEDLRRGAHVRAVFAVLAEALTAYCGAL